MHHEGRKNSFEDYERAAEQCQRIVGALLMGISPMIRAAMEWAEVSRQFESFPDNYGEL